MMRIIVLLVVPRLNITFYKLPVSLCCMFLCDVPSGRSSYMVILQSSGVVIVGAALCFAIGVPIALEMQSQQGTGGPSHDIVRKLLTEVPLVDG